MSCQKNSICADVFAELRKIVQAIGLQSKSLEKQVGMTGSQWITLKEIADLGEASVGIVARNLSLSNGTVTGIVERMENRGLVARRKSIEDRRRVLVRATHSGNRLLEKATPLIEDTYANRFDALPVWKQTMILCSLQLLLNVMGSKPVKG